MTALPSCRVESLRLFAFRNYGDETVEFGPGLNVLSGRNAQGKTNLLEAVATAALTRSPRVGASGELIAWGQPAGRVQATVVRPEGPRSLDLQLRRADSGDRVTRTVRVDGHERPARSVLGVCPVVLFWPEDLLVVKGGPDGRRRLLDVTLAQLDARTAAEMVRYRRVLDQRNALLRRAREGEDTAAALPGFTAELARSGGWVQAARVRLLAALEPLARDGLAALSDGRESLALRYAVEGSAAPPDADPAAAAEALAAILARRSAEELARGVTVAGPHRDDVDILIDGRPARTTASQGQQRSIVLAWKLAEVRHVADTAGVTPVLLLDDVLSELDAERRGRLLDGLGAGRRAQALLTTTESGDPGGGALDVRLLRVAAGRVRPAEELSAEELGAPDLDVERAS